MPQQNNELTVCDRIPVIGLGDDGLTHHDPWLTHWQSVCTRIERFHA